MQLFFSDIFGTIILFSITKKKRMTSLKEISAGVVSDQLKFDEDIAYLEIPKTLFDDIKASREDEWRSKQVCVVRRKRKIEENFLTVVKSMKECPFCGRANFKRLKSHISKNKECQLKYKMQLEFQLIDEGCYW